MFRRCKRAISLLALTPLAALSALAGQDKQPALPPELEPVYTLALASPPEIASSALLRLAALVADLTLRRGLLEMAFHLATDAKYPIRLTSYPGSEEGTRTGSLSSALRLNLDALSLQSGAIEEMIAADPIRARQLFRTMARPAPPVLTCEASLLPDVAPYFEALVALTQGAFSPLERSNGEHVTFAMAELAQASSLAEFGVVGRTIAALDWPRPEFESALRRFAVKIGNAPADSRSFLFFVKSIDDAIRLLVARSRQLGVSPDGLIDAYRGFLSAQLHAARCTDTGPHVRIPPLSSLFGEAMRSDKPPISNEELMPVLFDTGMKLNLYWETPEAQRIFADCLNLRQTAAASHDPTRELSNFLNSLENWALMSEASEEDYFHQKAIVYQALFEIAGEGALGDRVVDSFVHFLTSSNLQRQNPVEWLSRARGAVNRLRSAHPNQTAKILAAYRSSGNAVLRLEALLQQLAPVNPAATPGDGPERYRRSISVSTTGAFCLNHLGRAPVCNLLYSSMLSGSTIASTT
jgi:hypothetical protein